jgi:hypothetical protein
MHAMLAGNFSNCSRLSPGAQVAILHSPKLLRRSNSLPIGMAIQYPDDRRALRHFGLFLSEIEMLQRGKTLYTVRLCQSRSLKSVVSPSVHIYWTLTA